MHVVRFDYFGTGDSGGEESAVTLAGMQRDVTAAIEAVRDISGAARVELIGLRLGANVAARVAEVDSGIGSLVLWDALDHPALPARVPGRVLRLVTEPAVVESEAVQVRGPRCWEEAAAVTGVLPVTAYQQIEAWLA
jgi:pimeloyl-ACP methyl ester carboxylesterase